MSVKWQSIEPFHGIFGKVYTLTNLVVTQIIKRHDITEQECRVLAACHLSTHQDKPTSLARQIKKYLPKMEESNFYHTLKRLVNKGLLDIVRPPKKYRRYGVTGKGHYLIRDYNNLMKLQINLIKSIRVK